jgi:hypothetical protein
MLKYAIWPATFQDTSGELFHFPVPLLVDSGIHSKNFLMKNACQSESAAT